MQQQYTCSPHIHSHALASPRLTYTRLTYTVVTIHASLVGNRFAPHEIAPSQSQQPEKQLEAWRNFPPWHTHTPASAMPSAPSEKARPKSWADSSLARPSSLSRDSWDRSSRPSAYSRYLPGSVCQHICMCWGGGIAGVDMANVAVAVTCVVWCHGHGLMWPAWHPVASCQVLCISRCIQWQVAKWPGRLSRAFGEPPLSCPLCDAQTKYATRKATQYTMPRT